ncbi:MAG: ComEC/Rec2 family competence protein [Roseburia sp.]|nr:ComEC/Rec2 family competence protein [Roseburia sp.]
MKRPLCILAASFLSGILAAAYGGTFPMLPAIAILLAVVVVGAVLGAFLRRIAPERERKYGGRFFVLLLLGALAFCAGSGKYQREEQNKAAYLPALVDGMRLSVQGTLAGKQIRNDQYIYELTSCIIGPDQNNSMSKEPVPCNRILVYSDSDSYSIGQILILDGTVKLWKDATNEGSFDEEAFYRSLKYDFGLKDVAVRASYGKSGGIREKLWQLRCRLKMVYQETMDEEKAGIITTMAAGDKELLDTEIKRLYQVGGLSHILAISGLHISIIGMTLYRLLRKMGLGFGTAGIFAGSVMYAYGVMAGGSVSVRRSVLMFLLFLGAQVLGRSYDSLSALGAAALFLLWDNPYLLWNAGFLFSFAAVIGVVWVGGCVPFDTKTRAGKWAGNLFTAAAIQLTTLPLVAWNYYEIPVYALLVNLVVLPCVGVLLKCGVLGGLVGIGWLPAAKVILFPCQLLLSVINHLCAFAEKLPGAMRITGQPDAWRMAVYYGVLAACTVCAYRRKRWGKPQKTAGETGEQSGRRKLSELSAGEKEERSRRRKLSELSAGRMGERNVPEKDAAGKKMMCQQVIRAVAVGALLLCILCIPAKGGFELDVLDVGQGDGCFLRTADGYTVFVDGGSSDVGKVGTYRILPFLKYNGVRRIDCWIVSHTDEDHISGLKEILAEGYPVGRLVLARGIVRDEAWEELVSLAAEAETEVVYMDGGDVMHLGEAALTALYPVGGGKADGWSKAETAAGNEMIGRSAESMTGAAGTSGEVDKNAMSLVIWYQDDKFTGIFTGDIGSAQEQEMIKRLREAENITGEADESGEADGIEKADAAGCHKVDFYKAAHHGSRYSNSEEFLQMLAPRVSVVSCSATNRYGHPAGEAVMHMEEAGSAVFYTMEAGQITITVENEELRIRKYGEPGKVYVR